eukprot:gene8168-12584_t
MAMTWVQPPPHAGPACACAGCVPHHHHHHHHHHGGYYAPEPFYQHPAHYAAAAPPAPPMAGGRVLAGGQVLGEVSDGMLLWQRAVAAAAGQPAGTHGQLPLVEATTIVAAEPEAAPGKKKTGKRSKKRAKAQAQQQQQQAAVEGVVLLQPASFVSGTGVIRGIVEHELRPADEAIVVDLWHGSPPDCTMDRKTAKKKKRRSQAGAEGASAANGPIAEPSQDDANGCVVEERGRKLEKACPLIIARSASTEPHRVDQPETQPRSSSLPPFCTSPPPPAAPVELEYSRRPLQSPPTSANPAPSSSSFDASNTPGSLSLGGTQLHPFRYLLSNL